MRSVWALWLLVSIAAGSPPTQDRLARAEELLQKKDYAAAESLLREVVRDEPSNARAHGNLALTLLALNKTPEAVEEGRRAAEAAPGSPEARVIYGLALVRAGRNPDAAREFERAMAAKPDQTRPMQLLAEAYAASGDERAATVYERLVAREPLRRRHRLAFAVHLWDTGKTERANEVAATALADFPDFAELHADYGRALFDQQRYLDATDSLSRARDLGVRDAATLGLLGQAFWQAGRLEPATSAYEAAVREHPESDSLSVDLGRLLLSQGRNEDAIVPLEAAVRLAPKNAAAQFQLGRAREAVGRFEEAEEAYRRAVALSPRLASPHYALGRLLLARGRRSEAERELAVYRELYDRAAKQIETAQARDAEVALGWAELARGDNEAALRRFNSLPETGETLRGGAAALSRLRRHDAAVRQLEQARELDPGNRRIEADLAAERARVQEGL